MEKEAAARFQAENERIGIRVRTAVGVKRIEPANGRLRIVFSHDCADHSAEAARIVNGVGRVANIDTLDLSAGHVVHTNGRVALDYYLPSISTPQIHFLHSPAH